MAASFQKYQSPALQKSQLPMWPCQLLQLTAWLSLLFLLLLLLYCERCICLPQVHSISSESSEFASSKLTIPPSCFIVTLCRSFFVPSRRHFLKQSSKQAKSKQKERRPFHISPRHQIQTSSPLRMHHKSLQLSGSRWDK